MLEIFVPNKYEREAGILDLLRADLQITPPSIALDLAPLILPSLGEYGEEIKGISEAPECQSIASLGLLVVLNVIYEVEAGCTSIVARMPNNTIIHG